MFKILIGSLALLLLSQGSMHAQTEFAQLGTLKLSKKQYTTVVVDSSGLFILATGENGRRQFRTYSSKGEFIKALVLREAHTKKLAGPVGYLQDSTTVTYYFPPISGKFDLEKVIINKYTDRGIREDIKLLKGKTQILTAINEPDKLTVLFYNRKSKQLQYIQSDSAGGVNKGVLKADESTINILRHVDGFQLVTANMKLEPGQLISDGKIYPRGANEYLITVDPTESKDRGIIKLLTLNMERKSLIYNRLLDGISPNPGSIRSFVEGDLLYRLITERLFLDLTLFDVSSLKMLKSFHYDKDDDFELAQSEVVTIGGKDAFGLHRLNERLTKTRVILAKLAAGKPILSVSNDPSGFKRLNIGSFRILPAPGDMAPPFLNPWGANTFISFSISLSAGRASSLSNTLITKFHSLFDPETLSVVEKRIRHQSMYDRIRVYSRRNDSEFIYLFSFEFPQNQVLLAVESKKKGLVKLLRFIDY